MIIDCQSCPVQGERCPTCMVSAMLAEPAPAPVPVDIPGRDLPLDSHEQRAVGVLVAAGLVSASHAAALHARAEPWSSSRSGLQMRSAGQAG